MLLSSETSSNIVEGYTTGAIPTYNKSCLTSKSINENGLRTGQDRKGIDAYGATREGQEASP